MLPDRSAAAMNNLYILPLSDPRATLETAGGKGASLARLATAGLPVPGGFHVTTLAYNRFVAENQLSEGILAAVEKADPSQPGTLDAASRAIVGLFERAEISSEIASEIAEAYCHLADDNPPVAVRSSATAEDLPELSFAGQQETYLNVAGVPEVLAAIKRCWASLWTARAIGYRIKNRIDHQAVSLAVVVQALVPAEAAGILFTANPINGRRDQAVINASWGLGEAVVGGLVTPDTITVEKASARILDQQIADKAVMTVRVKGSTQEQPVPAELRSAQVLDDEQAAELTRLGVHIEQLYQMPVDIEWALAEGKFAILQARPVTALPEAEAPEVTEWPLPNPKGKYMRASIVDFMPDPLSPLFATGFLPVIGRQLVQMMRDVTHSDPGLPEDLFITINGYAYYSVNFNRRAWWWIVTGLGPQVPRLIRDGVSLWRDDMFPRYAREAARWQNRSLEPLSERELLGDLEEAIKASTYYLVSIMVAILGSAGGSEGLFTQLYDKRLREEGDPAAPAFLMGYDTAPIRAEKSLYDLAMRSRERKELAAYLLHTPAKQISVALENSQPPAGVPDEDWQEFRRVFQQHLREYGHAIYDLDFARPLPVDEPGPMIEVCKMYLRGEGGDPHERQHQLAEKRQQATDSKMGRLKGLRRWAFKKSLGWAQALAEVREDAIAGIGLCYPSLRQMLLELGRRFARLGVLASPEDIFWMEWAEVEKTVQANESGKGSSSLEEVIQQRKAIWRARKRVSPPPMLPPSKKYLGISTELWLPVVEGQSGDTLKGIGASAGRVTGTARVLHGPEDFDQMQPGDVLVATITTPAWTPLFAMASAIVTDIGGP
ncbi:MAG: phosphoenolpyruvate synthase, partial [Chloroflexota bacterium]